MRRSDAAAGALPADVWRVWWRGGAVAKGSLTFVSQAALAVDIKNRFDLAKTLSAVKSIRGMRKQHMIHNHCLPKMEIDAQTYLARADGNS